MKSKNNNTYKVADEQLVRIALEDIVTQPRNLKLIKDSLEFVLSWAGVKRIILLPQQLAGFENKIDPKVLDMITVIGLLGWSAFTIDDHIRDFDSKIKAGWISNPISNILKNRMYQFISEVIPTKKISQQVFSIIAEMESVNKMEEDKLLLDFKKMQHSHKSMGLIIPTLLLFDKTNRTASDQKNLFKFFEYFISARQISDDLTDLKEDQETGKRTYVTEIIRKKKINNIGNSFFISITRKILSDCKKAKNISNKIYKAKPNLLQDLVCDYEIAVKKDLELNFLKASKHKK